MSFRIREALDLAWFRELEQSVPAYLERLRLGAEPGRYLPCVRGTTPVGREMSLGFSCFALKTLHILGLWELVDENERTAWIEFLRSFQEPNADGAFVDDAELNYLRAHAPWRERVARWLGKGGAGFAHSILLAETKQAIASLAEVGAKPQRPFRGFPNTPETVRAWLEAQDWTRPWGAGGQAAGLVVFIKTQAPAFLPAGDVEELLGVCRDFYSALADRETGGYFRGRAAPKHGELINGAMKVLMALQWLGVRAHFPKRLIETTIAQAPSPHGCHLVDAAYVLHECSGGEAHDEARAFCANLVEDIKRHAQADGGFSFNVRKAQTNYYGVPITRGLDESDIQGTCLLVWALAMIWRLVEPGSAEWKTLRP